VTSLAFVFPGQGSQAVGMLSAMGDRCPIVKDTFAEASDQLEFDLWQMAQSDSAETLALTENTQPLVLTASIALFRLWQQRGGRDPAVAAGHSLGEFSALVAADSLGFGDAVRLVRLRGQAMQAAVPVGEGAMAAVIGLEDELINQACAQITEDSGQPVLAVNFNSPGQVVIAGMAGSVALAAEALKAGGAKRVLPLPVSAPFHTPLMQHAADVIGGELSTMSIGTPKWPVMSNVNGEPQTNPEEIRRLLVEQVVAPVRWTACMSAMLAMGCRQFVECGPGRVLSGLTRRINRDAMGYGLETPDQFESTLAELAQE